MSKRIPKLIDFCNVVKDETNFQKTTLIQRTLIR